MTAFFANGWDSGCGHFAGNDDSAIYALASRFRFMGRLPGNAILKDGFFQNP